MIHPINFGPALVNYNIIIVVVMAVMNRCSINGSMNWWRVAVACEVIDVDQWQRHFRLPEGSRRRLLRRPSFLGSKGLFYLDGSGRECGDRLA